MHIRDREKELLTFREKAWFAYRNSLNQEPLENFEDLQKAYYAGWEARSENFTIDDT